ncbi:MAG TPA: phosphohydrolase [Desulfobacterales bacterium]|nr:phosphohydrolase [Desulfobacterales bacterium]
MQCPGQDSRFWDGAAVFEYKCPKCGHMLEFFKDDSKRRCKNCGNEVFNPRMDFGCAAYCPYAEQCLGQLPPELLAKKQEKLITDTGAELKRRLKDDFKAIGRAGRAARRAAELAADNEGSNKAVIVLSVYFVILAEAAGGNAAELSQSIMTHFGANEGLKNEIRALLEHQGSAGDEDLNLRLVRQALVP